MSYNPAFVSDESPLAGSTGRAGQCEHEQSNGIKLTSFKILPAASQSVVLDLGGPQKPVKEAAERRAHAKHEHKLAKRQTQHRQHQTAPTGSDAAGPQEEGCKKPNGSNKAHLCTSTSSSLALIDNPTLSSLTPSASSYATTTSSILSSGSTDSTKTSTSTSTTAPQLTAPHAAVECRDMRYDVGRGRSQKTILYNINVTVPEGSIYGLLGPSGCGKTTMLRCVVGRIKPKEGYVSVFGYQPNQPGSQIPGPAIGYMPQVSRALFRLIDPV